MKKFFSKSRLLALILCLAMLVAMLVACKPPDNPDNGNDGGGDGSETPIKWTEYFNEALSMVLQTYKLNPSKNFIIDFDGYANYEFSSSDKNKDNWNYKLQLKANIDFNNPNSSVFSLKIKDAVDLSKPYDLFALQFDNKYMFIQLYGNKFKIPNAQVFGALNAIIGTVPDQEFGLDIDVGTIGTLLSMFFVDCSANADKTEYRLMLDLKKSFEQGLGELLITLIDSIGEDAKALVAKLFNASSVEEAINNVPAIKAEVVFKFDKKIMTGVKIVNGSINADGLLNAGFDKMVIGSGKLENIDMPDPEDTNYVETKIGAFELGGTVKFLNSKGDAYVTYDYMFKSNLDLFQLMSNNFDFESLDEDNYFHFRLSHICNVETESGRCNEFCNSRYIKGEGAVIDIGFDPKSFGNYNLHLSVSLQTLLGYDGVESIAPGNGGNITMAVPAYTLLSVNPRNFSATPDKISEVANSQQPMANSELDIPGLISTISKIVGGIAINSENKSVTIAVADLLSGLGLDSSVTEILNSLLGSKNNSFSKVELAANHFIFGEADENYNVYEQVVYLKSKYSSDKKNYDAGILFSQGNIMLDAELADPDNDGIGTIYNANVGGQIVYDKNKKVTAREFKNFIENGHLLFTGNNLHKVSKTSRTKIIGYIGLDYKKIGVEQEITIITSLASKWLSIMVLSALPIDLDNFLKSTFKMKVTLYSEAESDGFSIVRTQKDPDDKTKEKTVYLLGEIVDLKADATVTMSDGSKNVHKLTGNADFLHGGRAAKVGIQKIYYTFGNETVTKEVEVIDALDVRLEYNKVQQYVVNYPQMYKTNDEKKFEVGKLIFTHENGVEISYSVSIWDYVFVDNTVVWISSGSIVISYGICFTKAGTFDLKINAFGKEVIRTETVLETPSTYVIKENESQNSGVTNAIVTLKNSLQNSYYGPNAILTDNTISYSVGRKTVNSANFIPTTEFVYQKDASTGNVDNINDFRFELSSSLFEDKVFNVKLKFTLLGTYKVTVTLYKSNGDIIATAEHIVNVTDAPVAEPKLSTYKIETKVVNGKIEVSIWTTKVEALGANVYFGVSDSRIWDDETRKYVVSPSAPKLYLDGVFVESANVVIDKNIPVTTKQTLIFDIDGMVGKHQFYIYMMNHDTNKSLAYYQVKDFTISN